MVPVWSNLCLASQVITSSGTKKGELFLADVNTKLQHGNITTDIKVDSDSKVSADSIYSYL